MELVNCRLYLSPVFQYCLHFGESQICNQLQAVLVHTVISECRDSFDPIKGLNSEAFDAAHIFIQLHIQKNIVNMHTQCSLQVLQVTREQQRECTCVAELVCSLSQDLKYLSFFSVLLVDVLHRQAQVCVDYTHHVSARACVRKSPFVLVSCMHEKKSDMEHFVI